MTNLQRKEQQQFVRYASQKKLYKKYLAEPEVQDESLTVYAHKLVKSEARIDWAIGCYSVDRNIRAF